MPFLENAAELSDPVELVDRILRAGIFMHASDVHMDPMEDHLRVRLRIDGELEDVLHVPAAMQSAVTSRLKIMAGLDIAERRAPQDGGFSWRPPSPALAAPLDVRMATLPVRHGERVTLRLLEAGGVRLAIGELGMCERDRAVFESVLRRPHGLVLLSGPTGSGKTTTLYAAINELLRLGDAKNIITVEDPVEYEIPGVAQAEVDSADKVNFSKALKSILRHDPDVVMIGEIRDADSLDAAVKAALTGHLVLSTLHANSAPSCVTRLVDMGLDAKLVPATLRLAVAQRLLRRVCANCAAAGRIAGDSSCPVCGGRGYSGRIGVFEMFAPGAEMARTMRDDALEKVAAGVTTHAEVMRVLGDDDDI